MKLKQQAKEYIHQNITQLLSLRQIALSELQNDEFKDKVRQIIVTRIASHSLYSKLSTDDLFIYELLNEIVGLGPIESLLNDDEVTEIMVNGPESILVERDGTIQPTSLKFTNELSLRNMIGRILSPLGRRVDESSPMVDARLPDGSRFNAIIPPISLNGPVVTIRKFSKHLHSIEQLIELNSLSKECARFLGLCVLKKKNILIAGGTGTGKTTMLNMLSSFIPPNERIITIEDAAELNLAQPHVISLETRPQNIEGKGSITIRNLLKNALRMRPDRIIIGECRSDETLDMLQAMNTGHEGSLTTLHANSSRDALLRLETLILMSGFDLPLQAIRQQISAALDLIIFIRRTRSGTRWIQCVTEVCGIDQNTIQLHDLFSRNGEDHALKSTHIPPRFLDDLSETERHILMQSLGNIA
ncbi:MAG: CpaF family protein [Bdellovibrionales bacterium]|nr:CpaF family protein [Bdellovibrionales bacterium]